MRALKTRPNRGLWWALSCVALALAAVAVVAQQPAKPPAEPKYTEIKYSADASSYRWEGDDRVISLKGNVRFIQGDTTVTADKADYQEKTKTAVISGSLKIADPQTTITGEQCTVNFEAKTAALIGKVRMVTKPKSKPDKPADDANKSLKSEWKDEAVVTCDKVEYFYKEKRAEASGNLKIVQKNRVITADAATYLVREETLKLAGNIQAVDDKEKHSFSAPKVTVSLKEGDEWIEAEGASGTFQVKDEDEPAAASSQSTPE